MEKSVDRITIFKFMRLIVDESLQNHIKGKSFQCLVQHCYTNPSNFTERSHIIIVNYTFVIFSIIITRTASCSRVTPETEKNIFHAKKTLRITEGFKPILEMLGKKKKNNTNFVKNGIVFW